MHGFYNCLRSLARHWLAPLLLAGCAAGTTVSPTFPTLEGLARPDRVLIFDLAAAPDELEIKEGLDSGARGGTGAEAQTKEDIEVGRSLAKAVTDNLLVELRNRGITAQRAVEAAPPGPSTASLKGRFLRTSQRSGTTLVGFGLGSSQIRARILVFQGAQLTVQLVSEAEITTPSNLKPGLGGPTLASAVDSDAKQTARQIADRFADYYQRQGWIK